MKTIMLATDFSERSDRALRRAALLARRSGAKMTLVHVVDDDQPRHIIENEKAGATSLLREMTATLRSHDGVDCDARVVLDAPFAGIVRAATEIAPDLLVIGPHRRQVLRDVFVGTTAERTIRSVSCPVLMVNALPAGRYRHVLQTTDLSDESRIAAQRFAALGLGEDARASMLFVFDAPAMRLGMSHSIPKDDQAHYLEGERTHALRELGRFMATLGAAVQADQVVRREDTAAANEILKAAEEMKADLIVAATHGRGGGARMFLGSVTEQVLRSATVDVLAIPPQTTA
ncbi:universal stress protein [Sinisalibacter lacisalsi]|uniref:UspA domain-containing protein n=1 Tax=Sinisalibacter lacisalsi TaxID=1526570 RepID=A0ABQ1QQL2_9RHOB|nr:universal stress protein [Sinisalibacter lacisalsi]GGD38554.1 hypothetical protein GCM10011358_23000 [Sinisalibacter lacisalsi]